MGVHPWSAAYPAGSVGAADAANVAYFQGQSDPFCPPWRMAGPHVEAKPYPWIPNGGGIIPVERAGIEETVDEDPLVSTPQSATPSPTALGDDASQADPASSLEQGHRAAAVYGLRPFCCTVCQRRFTTSGRLAQHVRLHDETRHNCPECGKKFTQATSLKFHIRTHTGEKPHQCDECGKRFVTSHQLNRHAMRHRGEKPHECSVCSKRFAQKDDLKRHSRVHTGETPYSCAVCGKTFTQASGLSAHSKKQHPKKM